VNDDAPRMRITVVTSYFPTSARSYNGTSAVQTLRQLARHADIQVICPRPVYPRAKWLSPPGFEPDDLTYRASEFHTTYFGYPAIAILTRPFNGLTCLAKLMPLVRSSRPDVILNYWLYPDGYSAVRAGRRLNVPVVVGVIGSDLRTRNDPITKYLVRRTVLTADAVITVSEDLRRLVLIQGASPGKVVTILNGCDREVFHPGDRAEARRAFKVAESDEVILYAGSLIESKGLPELMAAFIQLAGTRAAARLVIVGKGHYAPAIEKQIAAAGLEHRLLMAGYQSSAAVSQWMRAADVLCLPSYSEGCPNVVLEALASGRPVVATRVGGIPELVNPACGLLVPPRDAVSLRTALDRALSTRWDTELIVRNSTRDWGQVADETLAVCRRVAGRS